MRIRPYIVLGSAAVCAGAGLGILVFNIDPFQAPQIVISAFWAALFLTVWGLLAATASLIGQKLDVALFIGFFWAAAADIYVALSRLKGPSIKLLAIVIGVTMLLSLLILWRAHRSTKHARST